MTQLAQPYRSTSLLHTRACLTHVPASKAPFKSEWAAKAEKTQAQKIWRRDDPNDEHSRNSGPTTLFPSSKPATAAAARADPPTVLNTGPIARPIVARDRASEQRGSLPPQQMLLDSKHSTKQNLNRRAFERNDANVSLSSLDQFEEQRHRVSQLGLGTKDERTSDISYTSSAWQSLERAPSEGISALSKYANSRNPNMHRNPFAQRQQRGRDQIAEPEESYNNDRVSVAQSALAGRSFREIGDGYNASGLDYLKDDTWAGNNNSNASVPRQRGFDEQNELALERAGYFAHNYWSDRSTEDFTLSQTSFLPSKRVSRAFDGYGLSQASVRPQYAGQAQSTLSDYAPKQHTAYPPSTDRYHPGNRVFSREHPTSQTNLAGSNYLDRLGQHDGHNWSPSDEIRAYQAWEEQLRFSQQYALRERAALSRGYTFDIPPNEPHDMRAPFYSEYHMPDGYGPNLYPSSVSRGLAAPSVDRHSSRLMRSAFLDEFRATSNNPARPWDLRHIYGHVVECCADHHGSVFIQNTLQRAKPEVKDRIFRELQSNALPLMKDMYGNYVMQNFFEHGDALQRKVLLNQMRGQVPELSKHTYGCRVVQMAIKHIFVEQQAALIHELDSPQVVMDCVKNENGNHVIQIAITLIPVEHIQFIIDVFNSQLDFVASHKYGCRVVQRMLEKAEAPEMVSRTMQGVHACSSQLIADQYGNYIPQLVVQIGGPRDRDIIVNVVLQDVLAYSCQKFASNVVEACVKYEALLDYLNDADYQEFKVVLEPQVVKALHTIPPSKPAEKIAQKMHRFIAPRYDVPMVGWNDQEGAPHQTSRGYGRMRSEPPPIDTSAHALASLPTPPLTVGGTDSPMSGAFYNGATSSGQESRKNSDERLKEAGVKLPVAS